MLKFSSILLGLAATGLIAASPAIAARMMSPTLSFTQTRAPSSLPVSAFALAPAEEFTAFSTTASTSPRRQSPLLNFGNDSPG